MLIWLVVGQHTAFVAMAVAGGSFAMMTLMIVTSAWAASTERKDRIAVALANVTTKFTAAAYVACTTNTLAKLIHGTIPYPICKLIATHRITCT